MTKNYQENGATRTMRYERTNDYYIEDTYTGQKLNQNDTIERLNQYENILREIRKNEVIQ